MRDDARAVVQHVRDVAQRAQVRLGRLELAERDRGERRVLAVGGEQPRVVREAGAEPRDARHRAERRRELRRPGRSSGSAGSRRVCVSRRGSACPTRPPPEQRIAGQRDARVARQRAREALLDRERPRRVAQRAGQFGLRGLQALIGARRGDPQRLGAVRRDLHRVGQLAAGALAVRAVVAERWAATCRRCPRTGSPAGGPRSRRRSRPPAGIRLAIGGHERGVVVLRCAVAERSVVGEDERGVLVGALVLQVRARRPACRGWRRCPRATRSSAPSARRRSRSPSCRPRSGSSARARTAPHAGRRARSPCGAAAARSPSPAGRSGRSRARS